MSTTKIIGMGLVSCLGGDVASTYRAMCAGQDGFRTITRFAPTPYAQPHAGQLDETLEQQLRDDFPDDDLCLAMMKRAGAEAFAQAGGKPCPPERLALVLATNFGPMESLEWAWRERLDTGSLDEESYAPYAQALQVIGDHFGCRGPRLQLTMSCASGAAAAAVARDLLLDGRAAAVLVLAYDALTEYAWCGLSNLHTITTDTMRPFDRDRSGTIFSEGAAAILLADADATAAEPLAWLAGAATGNNAFHLTAPRKEAEGSRLVMAEALRQAAMTPADITHVCAHATSTHANDETEAAALRNLFGDRLPSMTVAAHKSQLGHLLGAAGLAEAIITVQAMRTGVIPPTIRMEHLDPACEPIDCCPLTARVAAFDAAITNSAGIGGNNASLVLTRQQPQTTFPRSRDCQTLHVQALAWILPAAIGSGRDLLDHPEWLTPGPGLDTFSGKPYLASVKGYLDPGDAFQLAAFSLLRDSRSDAPAINTRQGIVTPASASASTQSAAPAINTRQGIVTYTHFGTCTSAFAFFDQLVRKGPRHASPMVFPHGYASAPGNLAAIELGCAGPHLVLTGPQNAAGALLFAADHFADDTADSMLIGAYEAPAHDALPDGRNILKGAIALRVSPTPSPNDLAAIPVCALRERCREPLPSTTGAIPALLSLLQG